MVQFINTNAQTVNNKKQTVLIETIVKGEVKTINLYCGNWPKRAAAFYDGYIAGEFKPVRKGDETKHYRLLKLFKAEQEAKDMGIEPNYMVTENYSDQAPEVIEETEDIPTVKLTPIEPVEEVAEGEVGIDDEKVKKVGETEIEPGVVAEFFDATEAAVVKPAKKGKKK